jgi:hypothetical protein
MRRSDYEASRRAQMFHPYFPDPHGLAVSMREFAAGRRGTMAV